MAVICLGFRKKKDWTHYTMYLPFAYIFLWTGSSINLGENYEHARGKVICVENRRTKKTHVWTNESLAVTYQTFMYLLINAKIIFVYHLWLLFLYLQIELIYWLYIFFCWTHKFLKLQLGFQLLTFDSQILVLFYIFMIKYIISY